MHPKWAQHLRGAEAEKFKNTLVNDTTVLERLYAIIEEFEKELDQKEFSEKEYDSPAFPYLKADRIGERRGLQKVKALLSFLTKE